MKPADLAALLRAASQRPSPEVLARAAEASADAYRRLRDIDRRQEQAVRRRGEMHRARREALTFARGSDGFYGIDDRASVSAPLDAGQAPVV